MIMDRGDFMYYYEEDSHEYDHWGHFIDLDIDLHIKVHKTSYIKPSYSYNTSVHKTSYVKPSYSSNIKHLFKQKLDKVSEEEDESSDSSKETNEGSSNYKNKFFIHAVIFCAIGAFTLTYYTAVR
jgi:hypothetical protein